MRTVHPVLLLVSLTLLSFLSLNACKSSAIIPQKTMDTVFDADPNPLRFYADQQEIYIGSAINALGFNPAYAPYNERYKQTLGSEFNLVVPEGNLKMRTVWKAENSIDLTAFYTEADFALEHGQKMRAHTLLWCRNVPDWLIEGYDNGTYTSAQVENMVKTYITDVMQDIDTKYPDLIIAWDVVNEAIGPEYTLKDSIGKDLGWRPVNGPNLEERDFWRETLGPDYVAKTFGWAREALPDAKLFYNDYRIEFKNPKADAAKLLIAALVDAGVPIDGVGFQSHFSRELARGDDNSGSDIVFTVDSISDMIDYYTALGLEVHITELDFTINKDNTGLTDAKLREQADFYQDFFTMALAHEDIKVICMWGCTDRLTWRDTSSGNNGEWPLLFGKEVEKKLAYLEVKKALAR